ncbi:MAG: hypothetical protein D6730_14650 [Bacteroidetes bacterium]|nr:MAG: hypothetical protein D6730_14650 [Bacteroidota bacterium]
MKATRFISQWLLALALPVLLLGSSTAAWAQPGGNASKRAWKFVRQYDPQGYAILRAYYKAPLEFEFEEINISIGSQNDMRRYIDSSSHELFLNSLNTLVHEACHGYTHHTAFRQLEKAGISYEWGQHYSLFYLAKDQQLLVKHTQAFPSAELHGSFPDSLITSRYHTYIYPSAPITTQSTGIYGLLDEWHAYYHGTKNAVLQYPYYRTYARDDYERWAPYFTGVHGTWLAYPEFKLYILHYLLYAQAHQPETFEAIMHNVAFKQVYTQIDSLFGKLLTDFQQQKTRTLQDLMMAGVNCGEDEEFVFLGNMGYGNFRQTFDFLMQALQAPVYQQMEARLKE